MRCIAFAHHKGGTGKTTSCLNIAGYLQKAGKSVLVVDSDPQANATSGLGVVPGSSETSIYDLFMSRVEDFPEVGLQEAVVTTESGIDLLPSSLDLVGAEPYLYSVEGRATILRDALADGAAAYDVVLVDTPPSMGQLVINGMVAADHVVVNLDPGFFALGGVATMKAIFGDIEAHVGVSIRPEMALITARTPPPERPRGFFSWMRRRFAPDDDEEKKDPVEAEAARTFLRVEIVPYSPEVPEAQEHGLPISHYAPDCPAGAAYREIAAFVGEWN
ncbi:ParA family protein [Methanofollis formosanus]|uniref:ParA family protein n=1 Tax=Methanofollis formosanus TaxID=299308 RepID=A0A8G0ZZY0_9EURY|nr:AAA family ATPase [Methanofollis formosanus]QYZ78025.1 ParA family protein [Methanofollis formosanus]